MDPPRAQPAPAQLLRCPDGPAARPEQHDRNAAAAVDSKPPPPPQQQQQLQNQARRQPQPPPQHAAALSRARSCLQWCLAAACAVLLVRRLESTCTQHHKALNDVEHARAEFRGLQPPLAGPGAAAAAEDGAAHLSVARPPAEELARQHQARLAAGAANSDWCAASVRDASSWARPGQAPPPAGAARPRGPPYRFPRIIHQTVEDKWSVSCEVLDAMQTWRDLNPGYEHRLYDARDRQDFVAAHYPELLSVYRSLSTNVERADLWRYLALHRLGGVYADSDVRCTAPVDSWNEAGGRDAALLVGVVYADRRGLATRVNNFVIAAAPCHPVMAAMPFAVLTRVAAAGLAGRPVGGETGRALSEAVIGRTGPAALTATIADYARRTGAPWPPNATAGALGGAAARGNLVADVRLLPRHIFTMGWETAAEKISCEEALRRNPGAYVCHQYFGTWKAAYDHRPSLTYSPECRYWGLGDAPPPPPPPPASILDVEGAFVVDFAGSEEDAGAGAAGAAGGGGEGEEGSVRPADDGSGGGVEGSVRPAA